MLKKCPFLMFAAFMLTPTLVLADPPTHTKILEQSCGFLDQIQTWLFGAAYVLGAIGLVIIAVSAFLGRFKFAHLIALGGGLFIVASADALLAFITNGSSSAGCSVGS